MKDLFIIPECYIDTNLVETLIITDGCVIIKKVAIQW